MTSLMEVDDKVVPNNSEISNKEIQKEVKNEQDNADSGDDSEHLSQQSRMPVDQQMTQQNDEDVISASQVQVKVQQGTITPAAQVMSKFSFGKASIGTTDQNNPAPPSQLQQPPGQMLSQGFDHMSMMTSILKDSNYLTNSSKKMNMPIHQNATPQHHPLDNYKMNESEFVENIITKSKTPLQNSRSNNSQMNHVKDENKRSPDQNEAFNEIKVKQERRAAKERKSSASKDVFVPLAAQIIDIDDEASVVAENTTAKNQQQSLDEQQDQEHQRKLNQSPARQQQTPQQDRLATMRKNYEKRIQEKWRKALKVLGINENMFPSKKDELAEYEPFKSGNLALVRAGMFREAQIERIVLEVVNFEMVNGCFHARLKDMYGEEIQGTFHANCKEKIKVNRCRKGSVVVLNQVSAFCITSNRYYLVMINHCIEHIF